MSAAYAAWAAGLVLLVVLAHRPTREVLRRRAAPPRAARQAPAQEEGAR